MKKLSKTILTLVTVGLLSGGLFCQQVQATPITGDITFGGVVTLDSTHLNLATQVSTWDLSIVTSDSGSFSSIPILSNVTMTAPWIFNPSTPTIPLWSVGGFTFDLTSSTIVTQTNFFLNIRGVGSLSGPGFTTTPGSWSFTISDALGGPSSTFGFEPDTAAGLVPEGGATVALLGLALAGVEVLRRKFKAA
jgi:protein with PEP-CTERM/exosortase system signal